MTKRDQVVAAALSWLKTPYHHCADVKGVGVDCAMILVRVFADAPVSLIPADTDPRPYAPAWHLHQGEEKYLGWLTQFGEELDPADAKAGDVLVWRYGRAFAHGAILVDDEGLMVHAYAPARCVTLARPSETELAHRESTAFRVRGIDA